MRFGAEAIEQIVVMDWVRFNNLDKFIFHIGNERKCSVQTGLLLKRMGIKSGVSDLFVAKPMDNYPGMWIEMKSLSGKVSLTQKQFMLDMQEQGYFCIVCYDSSSAIKAIETYLRLNES